MKPAFCKDILDQVSKIAQKIQDPITPGKHSSFYKFSGCAQCSGWWATVTGIHWRFCSTPLAAVHRFTWAQQRCHWWSLHHRTLRRSNILQRQNVFLLVRSLFIVYVHITIFAIVPHLALYPNKLLPRALNTICALLEQFLPQSISETCLQHTARCKDQGWIKVSLVCLFCFVYDYRLWLICFFVW